VKTGLKGLACCRKGRFSSVKGQKLSEGAQKHGYFATDGNKSSFDQISLHRNREKLKDASYTENWAVFGRETGDF
jgi:hypothetical protein